MAPHFEVLPHRNSQQNKERRPSSALKTCIARRHSLGVPGAWNFYRCRREDYRVCVWTSSLFRYKLRTFHAVVFAFIRISRKISHSRPWPVGYGVLLGSMYVIVCRRADFRDHNTSASDHTFVSRSLSQLGFALLFYDCNVTNRPGRKEQNM